MAKQRVCLGCGNLNETSAGPFCLYCDPEAPPLKRAGQAAPTEEAPKAPEPQTPAPSEPLRELEAKKTVLLVDDEFDIITLLKPRIEKKGYDVVTAGNGTEAAAKAKQVPPDLVVMDILMPRMTGYDFLKKFRAELPGGDDVPIIVISGRPDMQAFFGNMDIQAFFPKPFDPRDLVKKIQELIGVSA